MATVVATEIPAPSFKDVALEKINLVKSTSREYFDVSKNYVKENPFLSVALVGTAILASLPLVFVLSTFLFVLLVVGSIFFVVFSIMASIAGNYIIIEIKNKILLY